jgi:hypothetical protein
MKKNIVYAFLLFISFSATAQQKTMKAKQQYADLSLGFGSSEFSLATGYFHNWNLGKNHHFFIGTGARFNLYQGKNRPFTSAPADLASEPSKTDTLIASSANIYAINALINLGYNISPKFQIGFNIDLLGFSFGPEKTYTFQSNGTQTNTKATPTAFNLLLVGHNDKGSLNSEFYIRYKVGQKIGVKMAYQYLFTELTTATPVQTVPAQNDRFRNTSRLFSVGVSYFF